MNAEWVERIGSRIPIRESAVALPQEPSSTNWCPVPLHTSSHTESPLHVSPQSPQASGPAEQSSSFGTTIFSVLAGAAGRDSVIRQKQLERFLLQYGGPLKAHLQRRFRLDESSVEDLLHDFLTEKILTEDSNKNLAEKYLQRNEQVGSLRFRSYLLSSLNNFVVDKSRKRQVTAQSMDVEDRSLTPADPEVVDDRFEVDWAGNLLLQTLRAMHEECQAARQSDIWEIFLGRIVRPTMFQLEAESYDSLVARTTVPDTKTATNRLQTGIRKFQRVLKHTIANYLPTTDEGELEETIEREISDFRNILIHTRVFDARLQELMREFAGDIQDAVTEPTQVADLFLLSEQEENLWPDNSDLEAVWRNVVSSTLGQLDREWQGQLLSGVKTERQQYERLEVASVWFSPQGGMVPLHMLKQLAKQQGQLELKHRRACLPRTALATIYLNSIAAALVYHNERISRDSDRNLQSRLDRALSFPWLDTASQELLRVCQQRLAR